MPDNGIVQLRLSNLHAVLHAYMESCWNLCERIDHESNMTFHTCSDRWAWDDSPAQMISDILRMHRDSLRQIQDFHNDEPDRKAQEELLLDLIERSM